MHGLNMTDTYLVWNMIIMRKGLRRKASALGQVNKNFVQKEKTKRSVQVT